MAKETWKSILLKTGGGALKNLSYLGYTATGIAMVANTRIKAALGFNGSVPINVTVNPGAISVSGNVTGSGDWGNATIKTQGQWGNATITNHGFLGSSEITTDGWNGGAIVATKGWLGDVDLSGNTTFSNVTILGSISPNTTLTGTISIENILPLMDVAPWILASVSTILYTTGRSLELWGKNFETPVVRPEQVGYNLVNVLGENEGLDFRDREDQRRNGCCGSWIR